MLYENEHSRMLSPCSAAFGPAASSLEDWWIWFNFYFVLYKTAWEEDDSLPLCVSVHAHAPEHGPGRRRGKPQTLGNPVPCVSWAGEPGREVPPRQAAAAADARQLRLPDGLRQLLQGRAPRARCHPRGAAPPAAARKHLAAPQGPAPPAAAAVCLPAGRAAGQFRASPSAWGRGGRCAGACAPGRARGDGRAAGEDELEGARCARTHAHAHRRCPP